MNETETFTLPVSKKQVIVRGFVTGQIAMEIKKILAGASKTKFEVPVDGMSDEQIDNLSASNFPAGTKLALEQDPTTQTIADEKLLELMVTALDGSTADVYNRLMNLPAGDVEFTLTQIKTIQQASNVEGSDPKAPSA